MDGMIVLGLRRRDARESISAWDGALSSTSEALGVISLSSSTIRHLGIISSCNH